MIVVIKASNDLSAKHKHTHTRTHAQYKRKGGVYTGGRVYTSINQIVHNQTKATRSSPTVYTFDVTAGKCSPPPPRRHSNIHAVKGSDYPVDVNIERKFDI
jgi:hypothetical protein